MMAKIYILLPVHNRREITRDFIKCLSAQTYTNYHLLLIDDGSNDGTAEIVRDSISSVTVLRGDGNWWWAGSLQRGLDWLRDDNIDDTSLVLFINDDVKFLKDYLESAIRVMQNKQGTLVLSKFWDEASGNALETGVNANLKWLSFRVAEAGQSINCLSTRGLFVHWKDVKDIGNFRPGFLPHYGSDYEYTIRAFNKGLSCQTSDDLLVIPNHETTGFHTYRNMGFFNFLRELFSKKSPNNPIYRSAFVFLVVPALWVLPNLFRIWLQTIKVIVSALVKKL
jgi:GT2 family glycosyltransferase